MKGILIASHGNLAKGIYETTQMFFNNQEQFSYLCMDGSMSLEDFLQIAKEKIIELDSGDGVIVLCDLLYGTPCNTFARIINDNVDLMVGVNLPIVLELLGARLSGNINLDDIINIGKTSICNFKKI